MAPLRRVCRMMCTVLVQSIFFHDGRLIVVGIAGQGLGLSGGFAVRHSAVISVVLVKLPTCGGKCEGGDCYHLVSETRTLSDLCSKLVAAGWPGGRTSGWVPSSWDEISPLHVYRSKETTGTAIPNQCSHAIAVGASRKLRRCLVI